MNKRGAALIISYMVIAVLTILSGAFMLSSISESKISNNYFQSNQALWLADAGIQKAVWELNKNSCAGCLQCGTATLCENCVCSNANKCVSGTFGSIGDYDATIDSVNAIITSVGSVPDRNAVNKVSRTVQVTLDEVGTGPFFDYALFTNGLISLSNSASIDSYDSSIGDYNVGGNIGSNGDVGTNSTGTPAITLSNTAAINGDVSVGGSNPNTAIGIYNSAVISGTKSGSINVPLASVPVPTPPAGSWAPCTSCSLWGTNTGDLGSGSYSASGLSLSNSSQLNINGIVTLYITGNVSLSNSTKLKINPGGKLTLYVDGVLSLSNTAEFNNLSKTPSNLNIYSRKSGGSGVTFSNNTVMYGTVYAPDTAVTFSNSFQAYGAIVAKSTTLSNSSKIHYDEALGQASGQGGGSSTGYTISHWQEM